MRVGANRNGGLLLNFTNSPCERMMKEIPHKETSAMQKGPQGTLWVLGVLIGSESCVFFAIGNASKLECPLQDTQIL